eukprot:gb/GECG01001815.1/.p1 GENE.gb/GECG01001815.1/~~gb/GECG01001815.1/.p1  ORF type:complete len:957 (+),score=117.69 gb/GECG01001815.1/:1-2871(+)
MNYNSPFQRFDGESTDLTGTQAGAGPASSTSTGAKEGSGDVNDRRRSSNMEKRSTRTLIVPPAMEYEGDVESGLSLQYIVEKRFQASREVETVARMHFLKPANNAGNALVAVNEHAEENVSDQIVAALHGQWVHFDDHSSSGSDARAPFSGAQSTKENVSIAHGRGTLRTKVSLSSDYKHALKNETTGRQTNGHSSSFLSRINSEGPQNNAGSSTLADALRDALPSAASKTTTTGRQDRGDQREYYESIYEGEWAWGVPHGIGKGHWNIPNHAASSQHHSGLPRNQSVEHMHSFQSQLPYDTSRNEEHGRPGVYPGSAASSVNAVHAMEQFSDGNSIAWPNYTQMPGLYEGSWLNGLPHGTGKLSIRLGDSIEGKWVCGIPHGDMAVHVAGGGLLLAVFVNGRPHGCAVFAWPSGVNVFEARQYLYGRRVSYQTISPRQLRAFASARTVWKAALRYWENASKEEFPSALLTRPPSMGSESDSGDAGEAASAQKNEGPQQTNHHRVNQLGLRDMPYSEFNATNVITLLRNATVHDVDGGKVGSEGTGVITAKADDTVSDCLDLLTRHNIYSVPVWDTDKNQYVAIIHVLDIFSFMLDVVAKHPKVMKNPQLHLREAIMHRQLFVRQPIRAIVDRIVKAQSFIEEKTATKNSTKGSVGSSGSSEEKAKSPKAGRANKTGSSPLSRNARWIGESSSSVPSGTEEITTDEQVERSSESSPSSVSSDQQQVQGSEIPTEIEAASVQYETPRKFMFSSQFLPVPQGSPLLFACRILCRGVHSVPVVDAEGRIQRIVTVADVIRFLATRIQLLGDLAHKTVSQLRLGSDRENSGLVVAKLTDRAMDVMQQIREAGSSAAPVVDEYGSMITNLSVSDAKTIARRSHFDALQLPLSQFFVAIDKPLNTVNPSIYTRPNSSLASILLTLASTRIHQIYFVGENLQPIGCIRGVDIIKLLLSQDDAE